MHLKESGCVFRREATDNTEVKVTTLKSKLILVNSTSVSNPQILLYY